MMLILIFVISFIIGLFGTQYVIRHQKPIVSKHLSRVNYFTIAQLEMTLYGHLWENPDSPYTGQTYLWPNPVTKEWAAVPYPAKGPKFIPRMVDDMAQEKFDASNPPWTDYVAGSDGN